MGKCDRFKLDHYKVGDEIAQVDTANGISFGIVTAVSDIRIRVKFGDQESVWMIKTGTLVGGLWDPPCLISPEYARRMVAEHKDAGYEQIDAGN
jgi:hypothetical protein